MAKQYHTLTMYSNEWEDHDTLEDAVDWEEQYQDMGGEETMLILASENGIVTEAYDPYDNTPYPDYVGKSVDDL